MIGAKRTNRWLLYRYDGSPRLELKSQTGLLGDLTVVNMDGFTGVLDDTRSFYAVRKAFARGRNLKQACVHVHGDLAYDVPGMRSRSELSYLLPPTIQVGE